MKLNNKRTILVGLAFLSICAFWQMYDNVIPLILTKTFHMNETYSGAIMAADNILALFLLPFFGSLSDRTSTKLGKRMPFILFGTGCAVILMNLLPLLDNSYAAEPSPLKLASFVIVLALLLIAMGTYRSPAVALMPDVTPKPLRSRANAIINLMGAVGGVLYLAFAAVLYPNSKVKALEEAGKHVDYQPLFLIVSAVMFLAVGILFLTIRERKLTEENQQMTPELAAVIEKDRKELAHNFCRSCGYCLPCAAGINIPQAARMAMLLRRSPYRPYMTEQWYAEMHKIEGCLHCDACKSRCPYGLDTPNLLQEMLKDYDAFYALHHND